MDSPAAAITAVVLMVVATMTVAIVAIVAIVVVAIVVVTIVAEASVAVLMISNQDSLVAPDNKRLFENSEKSKTGSSFILNIFKKKVSPVYFCFDQSDR